MSLKSISQTVGFLLFYSMVVAIGILPFCVLYLISDMLRFLLCKVVKYRWNVITTNLRNSFPEKDEREIKLLARKFYGFLSDYFVETAKLSVIGSKSMMKRMRFCNIELMTHNLRDGRNVSLLLGHYGNWEWISSLPLHLPTDFYGAQVYHPLENPAADRTFLKIRSRFHAICVKMNAIYRTVVRWQREGKPSAVGYIADQSPLITDTHLWVDFLNQDTPVFTGPERISTKLHATVYYLDVKRIKRGYYEVEMKKVSDDAAEEEPFALTREYYSMLETTIRRQPELWLWSHRRWKRTRKDFNLHWGDKADKRLERL